MCRELQIFAFVYLYLGCKLSLFRLCDSAFGITAVDDITSGVNHTVFRFQIAHISLAILLLLLLLLILYICILFSDVTPKMSLKTCSYLISYYRVLILNLLCLVQRISQAVLMTFRIDGLRKGK
jgi:hypothetical protein